MSNLYYIIGASGSGKDSVMNFARTNLNGLKSVLFAHRYITRLPDTKNENHIYLTKYEFMVRLRANLFAMDWKSHDQYYGIGKEINYWMYQGYSVVVNGSREYLPQAIKKYKKIKPILIETSPDVLMKRLKERGRESDKEIRERIERNSSISMDYENLIKIINDGPLEEAGMELLNIISHVPKPNPFIKL